MFKKTSCFLLSALIMLSVGATAYATGNDTEILPDKQYETGDVNTDGQVNVVDATTIQKYLVNLETLTSYQVSLADVDENERVDIKDATYLQKKLAGLIKDKEEDDDKPIELPFVPAF